MRGPIRLCALTLLFAAGSLAGNGRNAVTAASPAADRPQKQISTEKYQLLWDRGFELPPGLHLRFTKIGASPGPQGTTVRYRVYADAAQQGTPYTFSEWRIGTDLDDLQVISESAYVNRKRLVLNNLPNPGQQDTDSLTDGSELDVSFTAAKGEPVRFVLRTGNSKTMIGGTLVPFPIESTDHGCKLSALLADPAANSVLLYADGFPPNSDITFESASGGAPQQRTVHTDAYGQASAIDQPHGNGADSGTATEAVQTKNCKVSVNVPWGKGSYKPM